ncbi:S-layer homology domain-containing protein [Peptoniphilus raoultii]|uniref:S-layer homology domain-containing protein n=1 Tax=Peptoniphilus raoultii TaxID=1776387 RepID=UPI0009F65CCF|nr:S-layer homology domain-containing protein [Peptoniphilus raoultii]
MNKRAISLLLAIVMILSTIASPIYAVGQNLPKDKVEAGNEVPYTNEGNKKIFKIDKRAIKEVKEPQLIAPRSAVQNNGPRRAPVQTTRTEKMTVKLTTKGLGNGAQNFDWSLFNNSKFTGKLVIYDVDDNEYYPQKNGRPVTIDFTQDGEQTIEFDVPVNLDVDSYNIVVKTIDNFEVRATYTNASTSPSGAELKLEFTVIELTNPVVEVIYKDAQGQNLEADKLPTKTGVNITADGVKLAEQDLSIPLPTAQYTKYNIAQGITGKGRATTQELNNITKAIEYKVDGKDSGLITLDDKEFKLSITNSLKNGSQIVLTLSKADQLRELGGLNPKTIKVWKDDVFDWKDGVEAAVENNSAAVKELLKDATVTDITVPERNSNEAGKFEGKLKISFDDGSSLEVDNQMLIVSEHIVTLNPNDPDAPKEEDLPSDKIEVRFLASTGVDSITTTGKTYVKPETTFEDKDFPQEKDITFKEGYKGPVTWTPTNRTVTKSSPAFLKRQQYFKFTASATKNTKADQVTELGGLSPETIKVWVNDPIDWSKGVKATKDENKDKVAELLKDATVTDKTQPERTSAVAGEKEGTLLVTFKDTSTIEVPKQMLIVSDDKVVDPADPDKLPDDKIKVEFAKGTGVTAVAEKNLYVKPNTTLVDADFPQATVDTANGYKEPAAWTPDDKVVTENNKTFTATAEKETTAEKVTKLGGLSPETIKVWVNDPIDWSKGVKATKDENKDKVAELLKDATVTDKTQPERTSAVAGEKEGTLLVTFKDTSTIEVPKQMLIVSDDKVVDPADPDKLPDDKIKVEFAKGTGVTAVAEKNLYVKPNTTLVDADFPQATVDTANGYKEPAAWTPDDKVVTENNKVFTATAAQNVPTTKNADDYDPHYTNSSGKPGETVQIDPPTFTKKGEQGNVPAPTDGAKRTTFTKNDDTQTNVTVDPNTGAITVNIPKDATVGTIITVPVDVTYPDGSNETVEVKVTVLEDKTSVKYPDTEVEKGNTETVTPNVTDKDGKPVPENKIGTPTVTNTNDLPKGVTVTPKDNGKVDITVPDDYDGPRGFTVKVTVPVDGKDVESEIKVTVKDKTTPTPQGPSVTYPDTDMDKGETKTVIPEIKDKKGEPTIPDTTPDVVQPGNGLVVTPHSDGSITVTVPDDYDGPSTIVIPVVVTVDGEEIHTTLTIRVRDNKPGIDYDIPEFKIHEYTPTYPVYASVDKKVIEKEVINSHDQYIFGYPDDTIRPDGDMTRAEAIAVVARLQKLDLSDKSSKIYKDTKADMWYNGAINAAFREGYLLEKEGENVRPNDKITRAELAELISHIDKKNNAIAPFEDVKGHKFEAAINQAYGNGRIEGYPDGTFKPDNFITRAEVATMLNKLYDRYPDKNFIDANQNLVHNYKDMSYKGHWGYYELVEAYHSHTYLRLKDNMEEWKVIIK